MRQDCRQDYQRTTFGGQERPPYTNLAVYELGKHLLWIDGDEHAATARQDFAFPVQNLGHVDVLPARHFHFARFDPQRARRALAW